MRMGPGASVNSHRTLVERIGYLEDARINGGRSYSIHY